MVEPQIVSANRDAQPQTSSQSKNSRKIRRVLQKKQLDVLLQTYSNILEESPSEAELVLHHCNNTADRWTIARKSSIEGHAKWGGSGALSTSTDYEDQYGNDSNHDGFDDDDEQRMPEEPCGSRDRLRHSKSLISDSDIEESEYDELYDHHEIKHGEFQNCNEDGEKRQQQDGTTVHVSRSSTVPYAAHKNAGPAKFSKSEPRPDQKRLDFSARVNQATEVLKDFATKTTQKHKEIAVDFQDATEKVRSHLKNGTDILFEDLSEHFDGVVQSLFVDGNVAQGKAGKSEQERQNIKGVQTAISSGSKVSRQATCKNWKQIKSQKSERNERRQKSYRDVTRKQAQRSRRQRNSKPEFQPLTHEETLRAMNQQVKYYVVEPVEKSLQNYSKKVAACVAPFEPDDHLTPLSKEMINITASFY